LIETFGVILEVLRPEEVLIGQHELLNLFVIVDYGVKLELECSNLGILSFAALF
jgi:hypothetical protein